ncbi:MAG: glucosaminidase domain-containing protein, partial [Candidatus Saccharimonadales bacterium]
MRLKKAILIIFFATIYSLLPLKVLAYDVDFFSANDILFYNPDADDCASTTSYGTAPKTANLEEFVDTYGQGAFDIGKKYGLPYEAILAQAMLESGYGKSSLAYKYYNFFGMKAGSSWTGETVTMGTSEEYTPGVTTNIEAAFRAYPSIEAGWEGYALFITNNGNPQRYAEALKYPGDYVRYLEEIKIAGYATDSEYVSKTVKIANATAEYIKTNNKWPPSSEVAETNVPTGGSGSSGSYSSDCDTVSNTKGSIVKTALEFALDTPIPGGTIVNNESDAKPAYVAAIKQYNPSANVADCGMFVGTVMIASGVDSSYPGSGTQTQLDYVKSNNEKYQVIESPTRDLLQPGDILIVYNG